MCQYPLAAINDNSRKKLSLTSVLSGTQRRNPNNSPSEGIFLSEWKEILLKLPDPAKLPKTRLKHAPSTGQP